jgi:hypothetical protein
MGDFMGRGASIIGAGNRFWVRLNTTLSPDRIWMFEEMEVVKQCRSGLYQLKLLKNNKIFSDTFSKTKLIRDNTKYHYLSNPKPVIKVPQEDS